jgi:hypothetical protein
MWEQHRGGALGWLGLSLDGDWREEYRDKRKVKDCVTLYA